MNREICSRVPNARTVRIVEDTKTLKNIGVMNAYTHKLQSLKIGILHEIRLHADEANWEMTKVINERAQFQQQYATAL